MNTHLSHAARTIPLLAVLLVLSGCSGFRSGGSGGSATLASETNQIMLKSSLPTRAYSYKDKNTADIYLTDLSDEDLTHFFDDDADWSKFSGSMVHVHLFLNPKPGKTPIEPTAINASIRYIVLSNGQIGVYDGAGFLLPSKKIGKKSISGSLRGAPTRLTRKTAQFKDPLSAARIDISFGARLDETMAAELDARINALASAATQIK